MTSARAEHRAKAQAISVALAKLAPQYYRPDFGQAQAEALFEAFVEDLSDFPTCEVELAIREYRRNPENRFFPTSGQIRALVEASRNERARASRFNDLPEYQKDRRPLLWWLLPVWKTEWRESDIPINEIRAYELRKQRKGEPKRMA